MISSKKLKYLIATGFGSGYSPYIPGTVGSFVALIIFILIPVNHYIWLGICIVSFILGLWASSVVEKDQGKDPRIVVIDEFVGQWVALLFLPRIMWVFITGFILFRILDIIKPFPAADMEDHEGAPGIMLDDIIAGIYTNMAIQIAIVLSS